MRVRIGAIDDCDLVNGGDGNVAHTIFFAGCDRGCDGCHNPSLQPMDSGFTTTVDMLCKSVDANRMATCVVITGGEPMLQQGPLLMVASHATASKKKVWLYTSFSFPEIPDYIKDWCDVIKTGRYDESKRDDSYVLASLNQQYWRKGVDGTWKPD